MRVFAAVDVRDRAAVQLVGGRPADERIRLPDPAAVADHWIETGFGALHVVDLDAALGTGSNAPDVAAIAAAVAGRALLQVGGGVRDTTAVARILDLGADRVVVGTRGVLDRPWLEAVCDEHPGRIVLAADVSGDRVLSRGWTETTDLEIAPFLAGLAALPLAAVLVTDVDREGREAGADLPRFRRLVAVSPHPVIAAGGIATVTDLSALAAHGAAGAVLGMALYTGRIDPAGALSLERT
jgi:phosphoribosylformimino-5-aminoimidazole carboxamide ribotide isomerase